MNPSFTITQVGTKVEVRMDSNLLLTLHSWSEVDLAAQLLKEITQRYGTLTERYSKDDSTLK